MALPILDGNQTATTLATTVSGGAHYPNHILASAVTISSLPAISGTVTAVLSVDTIFNDGGDRLNIGLGSVAGIDPANWLKVDGGSVPISGAVTAKPAFSGNQLQWIRIENEAGVYFCERVNELIWKGGQDSTDTISITYNTQYGGGTWQIYGATFGGPYYCAIANQQDSRIPPAGNWDGVAVSYEQPSIQQVTLQNSVTIGSCVTHGVTVANSVTIASLPAISGTVTASVTNSVTVGSLPVQLSTTTIGGTARLNVTLSSATTAGNTAPSYANLYGGSDGTNLRAISVDTSGRTIVGNIAGWNIPTHDFRSFSYTSGNLTGITYRTNGSGGTIVGTITLAYDGSGNLTSMTRT